MNEERTQAYWLACCIDEATPYTRGERGIVDSLLHRRGMVRLVATLVLPILTIAALSAYALVRI